MFKASVPVQNNRILSMYFDKSLCKEMECFQPSGTSGGKRIHWTWIFYEPTENCNNFAMNIWSFCMMSHSFKNILSFKYSIMKENKHPLYSSFIEPRIFFLQLYTFSTLTEISSWKKTLQMFNCCMHDLFF